MLAKVYNRLGVVSPITLEGTIIYHDMCCAKLLWDAEKLLEKLGAVTSDRIDSMMPYCGSQGISSQYQVTCI